MSIITTEVGARRVEPSARLLSVCSDAIRETEWRPLGAVIAVLAGMHVLVAAVLLTAGLPINYLPRGELYMLGMLLLGTVPAAMYVFAPQIAVDMHRRIRGQEATPIHERLAGLARILVPGLVLALVFPAVLLANTNLKPAIFLLNPVSCDARLEAVERWLFGGTLPTEWLVTHSSVTMLHFWDFVYELFAVFLFVSMMIGLHYEGMRGGARFVIALAVGILITLLISVVYPTRGPLYEHPEWFAGLSDTHTERVAAYLAMTVRQYLDEPAVRYAHAGISAMPSYHVLSWTCALVCWRRLPKPLLLVGLALVILNWISTVVLGWHYFLDGLAGVFLAILVSWFSFILLPVRHHGNTGTLTR